MKLLFAFALTLGAALAVSNCGANPFFYIAGITPPVETPVLVAAELSHPLCPTTFVGGQESCCTIDFLEKAQHHIHRRVDAFQSVLDLVNLVASHVSEIRAVAEFALRSAPVECPAIDPASELVEPYADALLKLVTRELAVKAGSQVLAEIERQIHVVEPAARHVVRMMVKQLHGAVCEACSPRHQLTLPVGTYESAEDVMDMLEVAIRADDAADLKAIFFQSTVADAVQKVLEVAFASLPDEVELQAMISKLMTSCGYSSASDLLTSTISAATLEYIQGWLANFAAIQDATIESVLETIGDFLEEDILEGTFAVGSILGHRIAQSTYGQERGGMRKGIFELWEYSRTCGPYAKYLSEVEHESPGDDTTNGDSISTDGTANTGDGTAVGDGTTSGDGSTPDDGSTSGDGSFIEHIDSRIPLKCMRPPPVIVELGKETYDFFTSEMVHTYVTNHPTYTMEELSQGLAHVDLFRLIGLAHDGEDFAGHKVFPKLVYIDAPVQQGNVAALASDISYEDAASPIKAAEASTLQYDTEVVVAFSAAHGYSFLVALAAVIFSLMII